MSQFSNPLSRHRRVGKHVPALQRAVCACVEQLERRVLLSAALRPVGGANIAAALPAGGAHTTGPAVVAAAPSQPVLVAASDSGALNTDAVTNFNNGTPAKAMRFAVGGTVTGDVVAIYADGTSIGSMLATGTTTVVTTDGSSALSDGMHSISSRRTPYGGAQSSDSVPLAVIIDTTAPTASAMAPNVSAAGATNYTFTVTYSDAAAIDLASLDGLDVRVKASNGFNQRASLISVDNAANGAPRTATYRIMAPGGMWDASDNASYSIVLQAAQVRDTSGNWAVSATVGGFAVAIAMPPIQPVPPSQPDLLAADDSGIFSGDNITAFNNASPATALQFLVSGTVAGSMVTLYSDGAPIAATVATGATILLTTDGSTPLSDGVHSITARQSGAGTSQSANSASLSVTIKTTVPTAPAAPHLQAASDSGANNSDALTNVSQPVFDVAGVPYYRVYRNGVLVSGAYGSGSTYTSAALADGPSIFTITTVDAAGNESPMSPATVVTIDTTAPTALASAANVTSAGGSSYTFSVAYSDAFGADVSSLDGNDILVTGPNGFSQLASLASVSSAANGSPRIATYQITPPGGNWDAADNGSYAITIQPSQVRDVAGNYVPSVPLAMITVAAAGLGMPDLLAATDSGLSSSDNYTNFNNSSVAKSLKFLVVNTVAGATVGIYADGILIGSAVAAATSATITTDSHTTLADGVHSITGRMTPSGGVQSPDSPALSVMIDTVAPAAPPVPLLDPASDSGAGGDDITNITTPTFDVTTTEPGAVHLEGSGADGGGLSTPAGGAGTFGVAFAPATSFANPVLSSVTTGDIAVLAVADVNGDGFPDVLAGNRTSSSVFVRLGNGNGTFRAGATLTLGDTVTMMAVGDFNGDGRPDVAFAGGHSTTYIYLTQANGSLSLSQTISGSDNWITVADFNRDGKADLAVSGLNMSIYLGNGNGTFQSPLVMLPSAAPNDSYAVDLNGDGIPDIATSNGDGTITMIGRGDGTFLAPSYSSLGSYSSHLYGVADMDGDGSPDFVVMNSSDVTSSNITIAWGGNVPGTSIPVPYPSNDLSVRDINRDGKLDLVFVDSGHIDVVFGTGGRSFGPVVSYGAPSTPEVVAFGDFNQDGRMDVLSSGLNSQAVAVDLAKAGPLPDGAHSIFAWAEDLAGNRSANSASTTITVDTIPPKAVLTAPAINSSAAAPTYQFTVTYSDAGSGVDGSTIDGNDLRVTGPNGFNQMAALVSVNPGGNGSPLTATYQIT
ncbi:MAG: conserved repeat domain protein, partial [Phycisphaerales bacterium]|nr:conserved repeat domain protein [Phycisphaerales bacterium]